MNNNKVSKVAICENCGAYVLASDINAIAKLPLKGKNAINKEFTELSNEGFVVKTETKEETKARKFSPYTVCLTKSCKKHGEEKKD